MDQNVPEKPKYIDFPVLEHGTTYDGKLALNRWSGILTRGHDFPGAQVRFTFGFTFENISLIPIRPCYMQLGCQIKI